MFTFSCVESSKKRLEALQVQIEAEKEIQQKYVLVGHNAEVAIAMVGDVLKVLEDLKESEAIADFRSALEKIIAQGGDSEKSQQTLLSIKREKEELERKLEFFKNGIRAEDSYIQELQLLRAEKEDYLSKYEFIKAQKEDLEKYYRGTQESLTKVKEERDRLLLQLNLNQQEKQSQESVEPEVEHLPRPDSTILQVKDKTQAQSEPVEWRGSGRASEEILVESVDAPVPASSTLTPTAIAEEFLNFGRGRGARGKMETISWQEVQIACKKDKAILQEINLLAGGSKATALQKEFGQKLPNLLAEYIEDSDDRSDYEWLPKQLIDRAEAILKDRASDAEIIQSIVEMHEQEAKEEDNSISTNTIDAIAEPVEQTESLSVTDALNKPVENEAVSSEIKEVKEEATSTTPFDKVEVCLLKSNDTPLFEQKETPEDFMNRVRSTVFVNNVTWEEIKKVCPDMNRLCILEDAARSSLQKSLMGKLPEKLANYISRTDDDSDLDWVNKSLRDRVVEVLLEKQSNFAIGEVVEDENGERYVLDEIDGDWLKGVNPRTNIRSQIHVSDVKLLEAALVAA